MEPTIFNTRRYLRQEHSPANVCVETSVPLLPERRLANWVPRPESIEITEDDLRPAEVASSTLSAPPVATTPSVVTIDLGEELYPFSNT